MKRKYTRMEQEHRKERVLILTVVLTLIIAIALSSVMEAKADNSTPAEVLFSSMTTQEPSESWG